MTAAELLTIVIAVAVPTIGGTIVWIRSSFNKIRTENELLRTKNETQREIINDLKDQNMKLEITGTLVNRFLSQLPSNNEISRERSRD